MVSERQAARTLADWQVVPLEAHHARSILTWRYPYPYDFYDPPADIDPDSYVSEFMRPELGFHAVLRDEDFVGFCSYGIDGQVPGGDYSAPALDIGLGMRPDLTGQGYGGAFFSVILDHATRSRRVAVFRLTVADFNDRALALYRRFGFEAESRFIDPRFGVSYTILTTPA